jgi:hypothetical protein
MTDIVERLDSLAHKMFGNGNWGSDLETVKDARAEVEELRAEVLRLWNLVPHPEETDDERLLKDYRRGVPLLTLSKERGSTRERIRHRLKKLGAIT